MKSFKRILKYIGIGLLCLLLIGSIYIYFSGPTLPFGAEEIIDEVLANPIPELVKGDAGLVITAETKIWYESILPSEKPKGVILLIMGISNDALGWPPKFIKSLTDAGYQIIRYDHRGTGLSDWHEDFDKDNAYSLSDMASDGISILNELQIDKAHILGVSMGGMIAQQLVIDFPSRVESLTSIMSSANIFDNELPPISSGVAIELIKTAIKYSIIGTEKNMIKLHLASRVILMGDASHELNIKEISEHVLYNLRNRKGYNPNVSKQHQAAVAASSSRYDQLKALKIPTLIIHGNQDPFIPKEHGIKCARIIPNADSLWVDNMGHDIPDILVQQIGNKIIDNLD